MQPEQKNGTGLLRRMARKAVTLAVTLGVIGAAAGLALSGRSVLAERADLGDDLAPADALVVQTLTLMAEEGYVVERRFAGEVEAARLGTFGFEAAGTVEAVFVDEGEWVNAGQPIARLDTRMIEAERTRLEASRRSVEAQVELARRTETRQRELNVRGHASDQRLDEIALTLAEGEARLAEIDAGLIAVDIQLEKAELKAAYDGAVSTRHVDPGVSVAAGQPIVSVLEDGQRRFRVGIAPDLAASLAVGNTQQIAFGAELHDGTIVSILPELDPATRTRTLLLEFGEGDLPPFGSVGELVLEAHVEERGAWLPVSALQDGPRGLWQVRTVSEDGLVGTETVEIIHAATERVFVRGTLTPGARVISDGPHRVVPGQLVRAVEGT